MSLGQLPAFTFGGSQPQPSPTATFATLAFDDMATNPPSYSSSYATFDAYEDEDSLSAAFAGDAFAPMWEKQAAPTDPWRAFHEKQAAQVQWQQHGLGIVNVNVNVPTQQPAPEYQEYAYEYEDDESMDEDATEAILDEEEAVNGGYVRAW